MFLPLSSAYPYYWPGENNKGNKILELGWNRLCHNQIAYTRTVVDLWCRDAILPIKRADTQILYLSVLTRGEAKWKNSPKKALRKKIQNVLFIVGSLEILPG